MGTFVFGMVVGVVINLITALFSRRHAVQLLPWLCFYMAVHGMYVGLQTEIAWGIEMKIAQKSWLSYIAVMVTAALLAGFYWRAVNVAVDKLDKATKPSSAGPSLGPPTPSQPPTHPTPIEHLVMSSTPQPPSQAHRDVRPARTIDRPSLDVLFDGTPGNEAFNFINHGKANLYLWGDRLDDGPKSIDAPRTITPDGSYHIWAQEVANEIRQKLGSNADMRVNFEVYLSTEDQTKYVATYQLWVRINNGKLSIETQNLGSKEKDFTAAP
jgi:hypothetical protein